MKKKLSIITVVYNGEKYIEQSIGSVVCQKNKSVEYIIIDGGSTDRTLEIINKYKNNIDYFVSEKDNGIYDAMNKGAKVASGDYLIFLNCDDYYDKTVIEKIFNNLNNSYDAIIMNTMMIENDRQFPFKRIVDKNKYKLNLRIPFMHPSIVVKNSIFKEVGGFDRKYKIAADCDFLIKILKKYDNFSYIDSFVFMRCGGASDRNYKLGRREYKEIYVKLTGNNFKGYFGYLQSMMLFYAQKIKSLFR